MKDFFLWPDINRFSIIKQMIPAPGAEKDLIGRLEERFPGTYPVIVSSGRAAITLCLAALKARRPDHVGIAPYSSACIFRSVGELATTVPSNMVSKDAVELLYHQWGFEHGSNATGLRINDSVDSFFSDGSALFRRNASFEIVSFAKIFGVPVGAVIFCATGELYHELHQVANNKRDLKWSQYLLRMASLYSKSAMAIWNQTDNINVRLPGAAIRPISSRMDKWDLFIKDREEKMDLLKTITPNWIQFTKGRYPTAVPVELEGDFKGALETLEFNSETRHYNASFNQSVWDLKKVFPFPIHHEISLNLAEKAVKLLKPFVKR